MSSELKKMLKPALISLCQQLQDERADMQNRLMMLQSLDNKDEAAERLREEIEELQNRLVVAGEQADRAREEALALRAAVDSANSRASKYQQLLAEKDQKRHVDDAEARLREGLNAAETVLADIGRTASRLSHDLRVLRRGAGRPGMRGGVEDGL